MTVEFDTGAEAEAEAKAEVQVEVQVDAETEAAAEPVTAVEPDDAADPDAAAEPDTSAEPDATAEPEVTAEPDHAVHEVPMPALDIDRALEAILMVADEPQSLVSLATAISRPVAVVRQAIDRLVADFDGVDGTVRRGFELREVAGGWRIYVRGEYDPVVADFVLTQNPSRLSQAALETLAVIAYKQPITRGEIASIRAVNVDSVVRTLVGRGLITESFTDAETGAINYITTDLLLIQLGVNSLDELPAVSDLLADGSQGFEDIDVR